MKLLEKHIEKSCLDFLRSLDKNIIAFFPQKVGGQCHTFNGQVIRKKNPNKGFPDLLLCINGYFVTVEFKSEKGRQSPEQKQQESYINLNNGLYFIVKTVDEFKFLINGLIEHLKTLIINEEVYETYKTAITKGKKC